MAFRYEDIAALAAALSETRGSLPLPEGETVIDGEWVLAIFEIGSRRRATAAAARGVRAAGDTHLEFERRDWERLVGFVAARSDHGRLRSSQAASSARVPVAPETAAPRAPAPAPAPVPARRLDSLPPPSSLDSKCLPSGARVLVVDDDGRAGDELRTMLADLGLVVDLVATTQIAEERMRAQPYDAIVLDLHAPGLDSRTFVGKLRADPRLADLPVLFLSNQPTSRDVVDAFASGGDDFLPKPFRTPELAARIFGLLRRARLARAAGGSGR